MAETCAKCIEDQQARQIETDAPQHEHLTDRLTTETIPTALAPSLIGDQRLAGRGNSPVRTETMLHMQKSQGNRVVQRAVSARTPDRTMPVQRMFPTLLGLAPMISPMAMTLSGAELAMLGGGMISPMAASVPGTALAGGAGGTAVMGAAPTIPGAAMAGGAGGTVVMGAAPTIPGAALAGGGAGGTAIMGAAPTIPGAALAGGAGGEAAVAAGGAAGAGAGVTAAAVVGSALAGAAIGYGLQKGSGWVGDQVADSSVGQSLGMVKGRDYSIGGGIGNILSMMDEGTTAGLRDIGVVDDSKPAYQQTLGRKLADWLTPTSNA